MFLERPVGPVKKKGDWLGKFLLPSCFPSVWLRYESRRPFSGEKFSDARGEQGILESDANIIYSLNNLYLHSLLTIAFNETSSLLFHPILPDSHDFFFFDFASLDLLGGVKSIEGKEEVNVG